MIGAIISHYKILEKLGGGGMGVVYKAEDTSLNRIVALKFLPTQLTTDPQARSRFLREAQAASKIEHLNICDVHDIGQTDDGETYIVMSFYDGETLKKKIARGPLKVEQSLDIAAQIADGLSKTHEAGIIHRDIKPANIFVTKDGVVKILDFGLAKLKGESRLTQSGATIGTLAYMPPEQVQGSETDARSDIWSVGVVLYEMLAGRLPFKGEHDGALLYEIMSADPPPVTDLVHATDSDLEQLVAKCLEKDPEERYQAAKDLSVDCRHIKRQMRTMRQVNGSFVNSKHGESLLITTRHPSFRFRKSASVRLWMALATVLFFSTAYLALREFIGKGTEELIAVQAELRPPENGQFHFVGAHAGPIVLSPDGKQFAYVVRRKDESRVLAIRRTDESEARVIDNPECRDVSYPFWSQDGQSLAFFTGDKLKRVDIASGVVKEICDANYGLGGSWNRDGTILFAPSKSDPICRVSEEGGNAEKVTALDTMETYHQFPYFLPDGKHFLFLARSTFTNVRTDCDFICIASLNGGPTKRLFKATSNVAYANGYLLYVDYEKTLCAVPFDLSSHQVMGVPTKISKVKRNEVDGGGVFTVSQTNVLIFQRPPANTDTRLIIYDRSGNETGWVGGRAPYMDVRFAPDGQRIAYSVGDLIERTLDIWIYDPASTPARFAYGPSEERFPVWSPDGQEMVFSSDRSGSKELYKKSLVNGAREIHIPTTPQYIKQPYDWSRDGKFISFVTSAPLNVKSRSDIWLLPLNGKKDVIPWLTTQDDEWDPRFSPDGLWIAFTSTEAVAKQFEVYVSPVAPFNPQPISYWSGRDRTGGRGPRWANGGKELFYLTLSNKLMVVQLKLDMPNVKILGQRELFQTHATSGAGNYDVSFDGKKILINTQDEEQISPPVMIVANWTQLIKKTEK